MTLATTSASPQQLQAVARAHMWPHFASLAAIRDGGMPVMTRAEGCHVFDADGKRYIDGLSALFATQIGYSFGEEIAEAASEQLRTLPYHHTWAQGHPPAIQLAGEIATLAPKGITRAFFVSGGSEAVESAWKLARQYHERRGERRWKVIARRHAYHGTTMGALSINGIPGLRVPWEPLMAGVAHVWNTKRYLRPSAETEEEFTRFLLEDLEQTLLQLDPSTVAMVILEPVQNQGGALVAPAGYWPGVRELCDRYGVLLCADEVITGFGRIGAWFASERYDVQPDIVTCAKGLASGYAPIGAVLAHERVAEPFLEGPAPFVHGFTYGGHPVSCAIALKNIEIMRREKVIENVQRHEAALRATMERLYELPIVGDVRGAGYLIAIELTKDRASGASIPPAERARLFREFLAPELFRRGLICRAEDRLAPLIQIAPPLIAGPDEFEEIYAILESTLRDAMGMLAR